MTFTKNVDAQNGDQILDGIGETDMVARYIFDGNVKDWSRNHLHGNLLGDGKFVHDDRFGNVLSLSGNNAFVTLPDNVVADLESISVSGWVYLRSGRPGQYLFDLGMDEDHRFFASSTGTETASLMETGMLTCKKDSHPTVAVPGLVANKWLYLTIVADVPSRYIIAYINGKPVGRTNLVSKDLTGVFGRQSTKKQLYIGKSLALKDSYLNALIHDFRIYRVPLNSRQVAGIYNHVSSGNQITVNTNAQTEDDLPHFSPTAPQLYNAYLIKVSDVTVETEVGTLPRLPEYLDGTYKKGLKGPKVRVLWPNPKSNSTVLNTGRYVVKGRIPGSAVQPEATVIVTERARSIAPQAKLEAFKLGQVSLNTDVEGHKTKFIENRDKFLRTLAQTDPNSFLYMFREAFGQKQPANARPLGVWDSQDTKLRGHATGHYLTALAQAYAGCGYDKALHDKFATKIDYMVNTLYDLSQLSGKAKTAGGPHVSDPAAIPIGAGKAGFDSDLSDQGLRTDYWNWGNGFISAYPPDQFIMLEHGAKYGGQSTQVWAPYYTLHKILAGLLDVYELSGNRKALKIATGMGDWVYSRLSKLPQDTLIKMWNTYIAGEYGGMNEVMARMYRLTNNENYLKTAQLFDNIRVFFGDKEHSSGLVKNVDNFRGLHANQHIPQVIGSIETYTASNNPEYYKVADNFWHKAVSDYMYSIGGFAGARNPANAECFIREPETLYENGFSSGGQNETCATYNMLKLSSDLFMYNQQAELMDYYERALYNHILASVAEDDAANTYHVPLRPGSVKQFSNADMTGFTCCNGTALESNTKLQNSIYFKSKDNNALYVNLYIASTLQWTERNIVVEQTTTFPKEDHSSLTIKGKGKFDLYVRVPSWATKGFYVSINGQHQDLKAMPGSYLKINRNWKTGDKVELRMPFGFHLDPIMDQQNIASLFYGPILLAAQESEARTVWRKVTLNAADISKNIKGNPQQLNFTIDGVLFKPFYDSYGRNSVYLNIMLK
ncbi:beta-L-arabinofuranosidase domain-containing protein [Mucilaginibacter sp. KACC 22063]|uniref:beta-L-arabinofuranosidase domain-containing protein n=1 Tax=Mucilaginibacter sp. KACC 22063 TaxID=3025666 RepID=UPI0023669261|nr:beta-L-arabinofuranosidase domain-containing protein [Mucilaginibacter sp. KACC 22063]WDF55848.1 glycoside hydrolase family 127 protein [Mucilaginibacter sp. KACC 22063]